MNSLRLGLIFVLAAIVIAGLLLPLRLALGWSGVDAAGLSARRVEGSVWAGILRDARLDGAALGTVRVSLDPLGLLSGDPRLRFAADGAVLGKGVLGLGRARVNLTDADISAPLALAFPDMPFRGRLVLDDATIRFRRGACVKAAGAVTLDQLALGAGGPDIAGLAVSGRLTCDRGALSLPLSGQGPGVRYDGALRIDGAGAYRLESRLRVTDPTIEAALGLSGFGRTADGFGRTDLGRVGHAAR